MTPVRFDSYMREDCNEGPGVGGVGGVLIHVCARIATATISAVGRPTGISIHACARIATAFISLLSPSTSDFDSCMCEDCNRILDTFGIGRSVF